MVLNLGIIFCFFLFSIQSLAQSSSDTDYKWSVDKVAELPEPFTNGAVSLSSVGFETYIYVFGGVDSSLSSSGIHRRCYKVNITNPGDVKRLQDLPDTLGRIALSASRIKNKIYIVGGYYVFPDGSEKSSNLVHEFDILGDTFTSKNIVLPVPIDDHVQDVWRDSLLYIINGWYDSTNVRRTQIYNPVSNNWSIGTPYNSTMIPTFGASGGINGDFIYIQGGARSDRNAFPSISAYYKGTINPNFPSQISWQTKTSNDSVTSYRSAIVFDGSENPAIIGGCRRSYNYNARDYSTGALLKPLERSIVLDNSITTYDDPELLFQDKNIKIPMDIRDWGIQRDISFVLSSNSSNYSITYLAGGILENGKVSTQILSITPNFPSIIKKVETISETTFFPIPTNNIVEVSYSSFSSSKIKIFNSSGQVVEELNQTEPEFTFDMTNFKSGVYFYVDPVNQISKKLIKK